MMKQKNLSKFAILLLVFLGIFIINSALVSSINNSCSISLSGGTEYLTEKCSSPCPRLATVFIHTYICMPESERPSYASSCSNCNSTTFWYESQNTACNYIKTWKCPTDYKNGTLVCGTGTNSKNVMTIMKNMTCGTSLNNCIQRTGSSATYQVLKQTCANICSNGACISAVSWGECTGSIESAQQTSGTSTTRPCSEIGGVGWTDLNGLPISSANLGDTAILSIDQQDSLGLVNKTINFTIKKDATQTAKWSINLSKISEILTQSYKITAAGTYIFNTTVNTSDFNVETSDDLSVSAESNSIPTTEILFPVQIQNESGHYNYSVETRWSNLSAVPFSQSSSDEDDLLTLSWDFGDGNINAPIVNYSLAQKKINASFGNVNYKYSKPGRYFVKIKASEKTRANNRSNEASIIVLGPGINVISIISSPIRGNVYGNSTVVLFDVSKSFIADCTTGIIANKNFTTDDGKLNCSYIHAPNDISYQSGTHLSWDLNLGEAGRLYVRWTPGNVTFSKFYLDSNSYNILLNITYYNSSTKITTIGQASTYFSTAEWVCNSANSQAYWTTQSSSLQELIYSSDRSIFGKCNMTVPYGKTCCPLGFACINGSCIIPPTGEIKYCSDLPDEKSCNYTSDNLNLAKNWISTINATRAEQCGNVNPDSNQCTLLTSCSCKWNEDTNTCNSIFEISKESNCLTAPKTGTCEWTQTSSEDHCGDSLGKMIITYNASGTLKDQNDPLCVNQVVEYPCSVSVKLPFFDGFTFMISAFGIALVYFVMRRK